MHEQYSISLEIVKRVHIKKRKKKKEKKETHRREMRRCTESKHILNLLRQLVIDQLLSKIIFIKI